LNKRVKSPASPASVEGTLLGDSDYSHGNEGGENHPVDPSHQVKKAAPEWKRKLDSSNPLKLTLRRGSSALP
jgi:hypothetical protein